MLSFETQWAIANTELSVQQKLLGAQLHQLPYGVFDKPGFGSGPTPSLPEGVGNALNVQA